MKVAAPRQQPPAMLLGRLALATVTGVLVLLAAAAPATADRCGGHIGCKCGDTVTMDYQLPGDLGPCSGHGLKVQSKVTLDCHGFRITGQGGSTEQVGVFLDGKTGAEVSGATVKACRVSGFQRGIRLRAAAHSVIADNLAVDNGDQKARVGYGIDVSGASHNNLIENNRVSGSADEGMHLGTGSRDNRVVGNVIRDNARENLYLLAADGNVFQRNTLGPGGGNSLYLKDSKHNRFEANTFVGRTARIIGDSSNNRFVDNVFSGAGVHFSAFKGTARQPSGNILSGGKISAEKECVRFTSSQGNVLDGTALAGCKTAVRSESPSGPSDNTLLGIAPGTVELDEGSTLRLGRRAVVVVKDAAGEPLAGAEVQLRDSTGAALWSAVTDASGRTPSQTFISEARTGSKTAKAAPPTLAVSKSGYAAETRAAPVIEGESLTISLRPN